MKKFAKRMLQAAPFLGALPALAQGEGAYTVPQAVTDAITSVQTMSGTLAESAAPAVLNVAKPWLAIGVIFFVIGIAWTFIRGRKGR